MAPTPTGRDFHALDTCRNLHRSSDFSRKNSGKSRLFQRFFVDFRAAQGKSALFRPAGFAHGQARFAVRSARICCGMVRVLPGNTPFLRKFFTKFPPTPAYHPDRAAKEGSVAGGWCLRSFGCASG